MKREKVKREKVKREKGKRESKGWKEVDLEREEREQIL